MPGEAGRLGQEQREPVNPPVDGDVVDRNVVFSQQLFNIAVGQSVQQSP